MSLPFVFLIFPAVGQAVNEVGFTQRGKASYYPDSRSGALTRSGEPYDMNALEGAHPAIAFNSLVKVTNLANGMEAVIRINDRPFTNDRVLDLTHAAAEKLGMLGTVFTEVKLEVIAFNVMRGAVYDKSSQAAGVSVESAASLITSLTGSFGTDGAPVNPLGFGVQVASFSDPVPALQTAIKFENMQFKHVCVQAGWNNRQREFRVLLGGFPTKEGATGLTTLLKDANINAFVRQHFKN